MVTKQLDVNSELDDVTKNIDVNIAAYLRRTNMNQGELAPLIGLSEPQFGRKRRGEYPWKLAELLRISCALGMSLSELTGFYPVSGATK